jgi:hypothetical protein
VAHRTRDPTMRPAARDPGANRAARSAGT